MTEHQTSVFGQSWFFSNVLTTTVIQLCNHPLNNCMNVSSMLITVIMHTASQNPRLHPEKQCQEIRGFFRFRDCTYRRTMRQVIELREVGAAVIVLQDPPAASCSAGRYRRWSEIHGTAGTQKCRHHGEPFGLIPRQ